MKSIMAIFPIVQITFQAEADATERQVLPWDVFLAEEFDFQAFFAGRIRGCGQSATIEEMDLVDVGNADHCKRGVKDDLCPGFL